LIPLKVTFHNKCAKKVWLAPAFLKYVLRMEAKTRKYHTNKLNLTPFYSAGKMGFGRN
jgi:hypothetical protein